ncbi:hypothetical protein DFH09DRAFT_1331234 [Mycena vulgaris]|nr:hypothetical protein DFH09DRAFT_1331234 [Mycena vulgaris]
MSTEPPRTPPPFQGRTARTPQTPCTPFDRKLTKAIPAGNFLIVRGAHIAGNQKIDPVPLVERKIAEIRTSNASVRDIPVDVTPFSTRDVSTSCYIRLHPSLVSPDPKAEPRADLLLRWMDALATTGWEVRWAPQMERRDKRMWLRVNNVFEEEGNVDSKKKDNAKVRSNVREVFDTASLQTVNGFKSGTGIILTFAFPTDLVIGGIANIDPSAIHNIRGWFSAFESDGHSLLVETRTLHNEKDYLIIFMYDWAATADILTSAKEFAEDLSDYSLRSPQLLFRLNTTTAWKADPAAIIAAGAEQVTDAVAALTRRIEANEHDARAHDADMKSRLVTIDANVNTVTSTASTLTHRQEELGRSLLLLQQENQLGSALTRIDTAMMMARQTYARPIDDEEKSSAHADKLAK